MRRAVHSPIPCLALMLLFAQAPPAQEAGANSARVTSLKGSVTVRRAGAAAGALKKGDTLNAGDELAAGPKSEAEIRTASGARIHIYPDSRLRLTDRSGRFGEFVDVFLGSIKVWIAKVSGRPNPHSITTPTAVIAVRGTTFALFVNPEDTLVAVDEGEVAVSNIALPGSEVVVRGGERSRVRRGQRPEQAQAFRGRSEHANAAPKGSPPGRSGTQPGANAGSQGRGSQAPSPVNIPMRGSGRAGRR